MRFCDMERRVKVICMVLVLKTSRAFFKTPAYAPSSPAIPLGSWCKDANLKEFGDHVYLFCSHSVEGFALCLPTQSMRWDYEECQVLIAKMMAAVRNHRTFHAYYEV